MSDLDLAKSILAAQKLLMTALESLIAEHTRTRERCEQRPFWQIFLRQRDFEQCCLLYEAGQRVYRVVQYLQGQWPFAMP